MITSYTFGRIAVDGREFDNDLIILPDGKIHHPWWRKSGHRLTLADLDPALAAPPRTLVVGTGAYGRMAPDSTVIRDLEKRGITVKLMDTAKAACKNLGQDAAADVTQISSTAFKERVSRWPQAQKP